MNLSLVRSEMYGSVQCDFWQNQDGDPFMTSRQLGGAIGYADPQKGMDNLIDRNPRLKEVEFSVTLKLRGTDGKLYKTRVFNEDGIYESTMLAKTAKADEFRAWVRHILKEIRRGNIVRVTPSYMIQNSITRAERWIEEERMRISLQERVNEQEMEIEYKESIIINLVDTVSLSDKRQILNRVVQAGGSKYQERWRELYKQFELKYHFNLTYQFEKYNKNNKPKMKSKVDYIDKVMGKIPELYEIAAKLYENDVKRLTEELYSLNGRMP